MGIFRYEVGQALSVPDERTLKKYSAEMQLIDLETYGKIGLILVGQALELLHLIGVWSCHGGTGVMGGWRGKVIVVLVPVNVSLVVGNVLRRMSIMRLALV